MKTPHFPPHYRIVPAERLVLPENWPDCARPRADLLERARRFGQIQPLLVCGDAGKEERLPVLAGVLEFLALQAIACPEMVCRILPEDRPPVERFALQILHDLQVWEESPLLQSWLVSAMQEALPEVEWRELLPLLPLSTGKTAELTALLQLAPDLQAAVHSRLVPLKSLPLFRRLPVSGQVQALALIQRFRFGGSKQQRLLEGLVELVLREGLGVDELTAQWQQSEPPDDNRPQEGQHLLHWLETRVNPELAQAEERFQKRVRALHAPLGFSFSHTKSFEDEGVSVQLACRNWEEVEAVWPGLVQLVERKVA